MKPWSATLIGLALSSTAMAGHGPFTGVYGGLSAGGTQIETYHDSAHGAQGGFSAFFTQSPKDTDVSGVIGINLGYNVRIEDFFIVGIQGRAHWENINVNHGVNLAINSGSSSNTGWSNVSLNLDNDLAILAKLGIMLDADFLFYGLIGIDWGQFTYDNNTSSLSGSSNFLLVDNSTEYNSALLLGFGLEYLLSHALSIGMEYSYVNYAELDGIETLNHPISSSINAFSSNIIDARTNKVTLNLNYYFG